MPNIELTVALCALSAAFGWGMHVLFVQETRKQAEILRNTKAGQIGRQAKEDQESRMLMALAEAAAMFKEGMPPLEIAKTLAPKYPDVASKLITKAMKGELPKELMGGE